MIRCFTPFDSFVASIYESVRYKAEFPKPPDDENFCLLIERDLEAFKKKWLYF